MTTLSSDAWRDFFHQSAALVEAELGRLLPAAHVEPVSVHEAMRWSVFAGGKRLRPALVLATGQAFGASVAQLIRTACAFEMVHTYSLMHDDLPAMDNDDLRRGRPTCHIKYGEAIAILAGDVLQTLAFQAIAEDKTLPAITRVSLVSELARGAGTPRGMVAGQAYDLDAETRRDVTAAELERIHRHKTGALITAAVRCGAIIGAAQVEELSAVTRYAEALGLLFQITDDILDVTATAADLGKTPGKDAHAHKATYPALYGLDGARKLALEQCLQAKQALDEIARSVTLLRELANMTLTRRK